MATKWCTKLEVAEKRRPIVFQTIFQTWRSHGTTKNIILTQFGRFRTVTLVWIHQWLWNDAQSLRQHRRGAILFFNEMSSIKFQGHMGLKIADFDTKWTFQDRNSSLNSPMALKWCTMVDVVKKMCPIVFQGHPSNFKVTRDNQLPFFYPNWAFPDCNFRLNSPMNLKWCRKLDVILKRCPIIFRGHPSNFKVTRAEK